jgi:hypothetical protein
MRIPGIGQLGDKVKLLLDIDKVLSSEDMRHPRALGAAHGGAAPDKKETTS